MKTFRDPEPSDGRCVELAYIFAQAVTRAQKQAELLRQRPEKLVAQSGRIASSGLEVSPETVLSVHRS
jgi:hypothetical protein